MTPGFCPERLLSAQLPQKKSAQTMESVSDTWLNFGPSSGVIDGILAILCGVGIFLLLLPFLPKNTTIPQPRRYQQIRRVTCRESMKKLDRAQNMISLLQSRVQKYQDKDSHHAHQCEDHPDEVCRAVSGVAQSPVAEEVDNDQPKLSLPLKCTSPVLIPSSPTVHMPSSGAYLPHPPDESVLSLSSIQSPVQCHPLALPMGIDQQSCSTHTSWPASPAPMISGTDHADCAHSTLSWCQTTVKTLCLSMSSSCQSQQEKNSCPPQGGLFWEEHTLRQTKSGSFSLTPPNMELRSPDRKEINKHIEKASFLKQVKPSYHLPLKNMLKSLGDMQKTRAPVSSWITKGQFKQMYRQFSDPKILEKKYIQLFWGLPWLHSESLVATAWNSTSQYPLRFNWIVGTFQEQMKANISPLLSQSQSLCDLQFESQSSIGTLSDDQNTSVVQAHFALENEPLFSQYQSRACSPSWRKKESLIQTKNQLPEWLFLQNEVGSEWMLHPIPKKTQKIFTVFTTSEDKMVDCVFAKDFSINPQLQERLEKLIKEWINKHYKELSLNIELSLSSSSSLEIKQHQGNTTKSCQLEGKHRYSKPYVLAGRSKKEEVSKHLSQVPEVQESERSRVKLFLRSEESGSDLDVSSSESANDIMKSLDDSLEQRLKRHLDRKLGHIYTGFIPESVARSRLDANETGKMLDPRVKNRKSGSSKIGKDCAKTSLKEDFLDSITRSVLEAHIRKYWVNHRWGLPLKVLKPINILKSSPQRKVSPSQSSSQSSTIVSGTPSRVKKPNFKECPQTPLERKIQTKTAPIPEQPVQLPSPSSAQIQKLCSKISIGSKQVSMGTSLSQPTEDTQPTDSLKSNIEATKIESRSLEQARKKSSELSPDAVISTKVSKVEITNCMSPQSCQQEKVVGENLGSVKATETTGTAEAEKLPAPQPDSKSTLDSSVQTQDEYLSTISKKSSSTSTSTLFHKIPVHHHREEIVRELKSKMKQQPADGQKHVLLTSHNVPSQVPQVPQVPRYHIQKSPMGEQFARPVRCIYKTDGRVDPRNSLDPRNPRSSSFVDPWKGQRNVACVSPRPRKQKGTEESKITPLSHRVCLFPGKPTASSPECKCLQKQAPQNLFSKLRLFIQSIFANKKDKGQDPLQNRRPTVASAKSQGVGKSRMMMGGEMSEAQRLMEALGKILEEKCANNQGLQDTKLHVHKNLPSVHGTLCSHKPQYYTDQGKYTASSTETTPNNHSFFIRGTQVRNQQLSKRVRFKDEEQAMDVHPATNLKKTVHPDSSCQFKPEVPGAHNHYHLCMRHPAF
ncbi:spermatogenesis-associated protein 31A6-like [Suncus etruscus]|uniref:spermatogenesis-associated protein 31A6-like n=1 Tax=Suncus etruscus TaxID=109475 RepID=UPI00210FD658|nr:spermatogenesis-associated protein 31A6-like [Suncus etruscus]